MLGKDEGELIRLLLLGVNVVLFKFWSGWCQFAQAAVWMLSVSIFAGRENQIKTVQYCYVHSLAILHVQHEHAYMY